MPYSHGNVTTLARVQLASVVTCGPMVASAMHMEGALTSPWSMLVLGATPSYWAAASQCYLFANMATTADTAQTL